MSQAVNRLLTRQFIAVSPVVLVLIPHTRQRKASGGFESVAGDPRPPQTMTLIEPGSEPRPTVTQDGVERVVEFQLLGEWDAGVAVRDTFTHQGRDWEVVEVFYDNGYEQRALVSGRG